jgi:hypothetical protein
VRLTGHVARMFTMRVYKILVGKPEVKRTLRRSTHRLEDNIEIDLLEIKVVKICIVHIHVQDFCN